MDLPNVRTQRVEIITPDIELGYEFPLDMFIQFDLSSSSSEYYHVTSYGEKKYDLTRQTVEEYVADQDELSEFSNTFHIDLKFETLEVIDIYVPNLFHLVTQVAEERQ